MNRSIRQLAAALIVMYVALFALLNYWQVGKTEELASKPDWLRVSAGVFGDAPRALADYDAGRYCYGSLGFEGRWSAWGEAAVPRAWVERAWAPYFEPCEWISDRRRCSQEVVVARRRG